MKKYKRFLKSIGRFIAAVGILAFTEGLLSSLTGDIVFVFVLPLAMLIIAYVVSLIV